MRRSPGTSGGDFDAVVIGSGMGGLTAAALLARLHGQRVLVLERHWRAGGFTHTFSRPGGYHWDVGVHYVGQVERGTAADVLRVMSGGALSWQRMPDPFERLVFPDFEFAIRSGRCTPSAHAQAHHVTGSLPDDVLRAPRMPYHRLPNSTAAREARQRPMSSALPSPLGWASPACSTAQGQAVVVVGVPVSEHPLELVDRLPGTREHHPRG